MTAFYSSDHHFNHLRILELQPNRPWASIEEMNRGLIERWNSRVTPMDIVFYIGDFAMGNYSLAPDIFKQLNGYAKHLILGNHDRKPERMLAMGWTTVQTKLDFILGDGRHIHMRHHPQTYTHLDNIRADIQLCGHVHSKFRRARTEFKEDLELEHDDYVLGIEDPQGRVINCGVDVRDYFPQTIDELLGA